MSKREILIADDDQDLTRAIAMRCEALGLATHVAHDALTALNLAHSHHPDLICLDVNMPGGNGLSACEMISSSEEFEETPVIILTGCYDEETIRRCHRMCAYYVLKCPDIWSRVEPLIYELLDIEPAHSAAAGKCGVGRPPKPNTIRESQCAIAREVVFARLEEPNDDTAATCCGH